MTLAPTRQLANRYTLLQRIAVGGMGEVWRGRDELLDRVVAVKLLRQELGSDPTALRRFRAEARHAAALSHPGIASVYDYGEVAGSAYLVMELVDGEPLSNLLARTGPLDPAGTLDIVGQAAMALHAAHEAGVVHRDVKPGNLLIRRDGAVKVTDFGIARAVDAAPVTRAGTVLGTADYLSPEQAAGRPVGPASDVYSLGVVGYECLAGRPPFIADHPVALVMAHLQEKPAQLPGSVPEPVRSVIARAMAKDPAQRFPTAREMGRTALAVAALLDRPPADARPPGSPPVPVAPSPGGPPVPAAPPPLAPAPSDPAARRAQRRTRNVLLLIGAVVVLLGLFALLALTRPTAPARPTGRPSATSGSSPAPTVQVNGAGLVGQPLSQVSRQLRALGLDVRTVFQASALPADTVLAVSPTGRVRQGSVVTVTAATAAAAPAPPPAPGTGSATAAPRHHRHRPGGAAGKPGPGNGHGPGGGTGGPGGGGG